MVYLLEYVSSYYCIHDRNMMVYFIHVQFVHAIGFLSYSCYVTGSRGL